MPGTRVTRLVGVYDADGGLLGEAGDVWGKVPAAPPPHCALCDITHGRVRERADWRACRSTLPVEFATYHRDDQPDAVRIATRGPRTRRGGRDGWRHRRAPRRSRVDVCGGSPERLVAAVTDAVAAHDLRLD